MNKISINGVTYTSNKSIVINNGNVVIDGNEKKITDKIINIVIIGDVDKFTIDSCNEISVKGNVQKLECTSGTINIDNDVNGNVNTVSGDIKVKGNVGGNVSSTSGDIKCNDVTGKVSTMTGDITRK